jgi:DNA mismatch endonuclease, patch repair protein
MDLMSAAQRSYTMSRIRSRGNDSTERALVRLMRHNRISGWRRNSKLAGRPDFIFPKLRVAVFIDGCYWHGCPRCRLVAKSNINYWKPKIAANRSRDRSNTIALRRSGWRVIRIWEHQLKKKPQLVLRRLQLSLVSRNQEARR